MKKFNLALVALIVLMVGTGAYSLTTQVMEAPSQPVACTAEAMICPDGSAVGRTGPACEFSPCPTPVSTLTTDTEFITLNPADYPEGYSGIIGVVTIGPTCPVVQNPPEDSCNDKPYSGLLIITSSSGKKAYITPDEMGRYAAHMEPGTYQISSGSSMPMPSLGPVTLTVKKGVFERLDLVFDSGIR
ncbi:MAG: hypothetical protein WD874_01805 [Parcubacteria group bacterium]